MKDKQYLIISIASKDFDMMGFKWNIAKGFGWDQVMVKWFKSYEIKISYNRVCITDREFKNRFFDIITIETGRLDILSK